MNDYVGEELAQAIADYVNELGMTGKTVDKFAIMGAYVAYAKQESDKMLEAIELAAIVRKQMEVINHAG